MSSSKKPDNKNQKSTESFASTSKFKKFKPVLFLLPVLIVGFAISFAIVQQLDGNESSSPRASNASVTVTDGKTIHDVDIKRDNNQPIDLIIKKGEYVQFNSKDGGEHQIVQGEHDGGEHATGSIDSGVFGAEEAYLLQFKKVGKYEFHDNFDADYKITMLVYDPTKSLEDIKIKR